MDRILSLQRLQAAVAEEMEWSTISNGCSTMSKICPIRTGT